MTDLEMTKLCAEAMRLHLLPAYPEGHILRTPRNVCPDTGLMVSRDGDRAYYFTQDGAYDPLHDDAQVMALVKKFGLRVNDPLDNGHFEVIAYQFRGTDKVMKAATANRDLNRAIVECVAKMQAARNDSVTQKE
jgi:hypothetical protein